MGYTLSTYVSWHIRQQIQRWRWNEVALIRLPVNVWERLESDSDDLPAATEAAALRALDMVSIEDVDEDELPLVWDGGLEKIAKHAEMVRIIAQLFNDLTEREADVLRRLRDGLGDVSDRAHDARRHRPDVRGDSGAHSSNREQSAQAAARALFSVVR